MATQTSEVYFVGTDGKVWNNLTVGNTLTGTGGASSLTGTAPLLVNATKAVLYYDISIILSALPLFTSCAALNTINLVLPDKTKVNLFTVFYGGCTFPLICSPTIPTSATGSYDLTSYLASYAGLNVLLEITGCGVPSSNVPWLLTAYIETTETITPADVVVNVSGPGGVISGATVVMNDTTQGQSYHGTTDSSGNVSFNGDMNIGDDIHMTVNAPSMNTVSETFSIDYASQTVSVAMTATVIGSIFGGLGKYILTAAVVIGGTATIYEVSKALANREMYPHYRPPKYVESKVEK